MSSKQFPSDTRRAQWWQRSCSGRIADRSPAGFSHFGLAPERSSASWVTPAMVDVLPEGEPQVATRCQRARRQIGQDVERA